MPELSPPPRHRRCFFAGRAISVLFLWTLIGCGSTDSTPSVPDVGVPGPEGPIPYDNLSTYGFFQEPMSALMPIDGVIPYQVAAPLWADHAGKARFIVLPEGQTIGIDDEGEWRFPSGTIIIKNFFYSTDRRQMNATATPIETRLLIKEDDEWTGHTYVWNPALTEASRKIAGKRVQLEFTDEHGVDTTQEYVVPNTNQCKDCHEIDDRNGLLGLVPHQLVRPVDRDGETVQQVQWLSDNLRFASAGPTPHENPLVNPFGDAPLDKRARSYLDANCSHCHREGGNGGRSGLVLLASETNPTTYGVCKGPVAAGEGTGDRLQDIVPGQPEQSILIYRMESTDPEVKMPEIPNRLPHDAGVELISEWIRQMEPQGCP